MFHAKGNVRPDGVARYVMPRASRLRAITGRGPGEESGRDQDDERGSVLHLRRKGS
jgi:hypothetical protein